MKLCTEPWSTVTIEANELRISQEYLASLNTSLDKDLIGTAADKGLIAISEINFEEIIGHRNLSDQRSYHR